VPITVLNERPAESTCPLVVEISEELEQALRSQHERFSRATNPALAWDRFIHGCVAIGLDQLQRIRAPEALELLERLEG
jgi:TATA-binding protein-associated factor Taf7